MQYRLLDLVCCPSCKSDLEVEVFETRPRVGLKSPERQRCQDHCAYAKRLPEGEPDWFACSRIEVAEGMIHCGCGNAYPIIGGVPRFLPDDLQAELMGRKLLKLPKANETWF